MTTSGPGFGLTSPYILMSAAESSGGLMRRRMRESAHKLWAATLDQMVLIIQSFDDALANSSKQLGGPSKAAINSDLTKLSIKNNVRYLANCYLSLKIP